MAVCVIEGLDELIKDMERHAELAPLVFDELLDMGAEEVKKAWKESALKHGHKDTGAMIDAIDWTARPRGPAGLRVAHIYPQGTQKVTRFKRGPLIRRTKPVRYAAVAFMRHYGTKKKPGTYWVDTAVNIASDRIPPILTRRWREFLASQG